MNVPCFSVFESAKVVGVEIKPCRWSEDREDYPGWPDAPERSVRVIDSAGAAFANLSEAGSWRRESGGNVSTPPSDAQVRRMTSVSQLTKRR